MSDGQFEVLGGLFMIERGINRVFLKMLLHHLATDLPAFRLDRLLDEMYVMQENMPMSEAGTGSDEGDRQGVGLAFWGELITMVEDAQNVARERLKDIF